MGVVLKAGLLLGPVLLRIHLAARGIRRRESGLELTDRIRLWLPDADLVDRFKDRIAAETLAVSVETGDLRLQKN